MESHRHDDFDSFLRSFDARASDPKDVAEGIVGSSESQEDVARAIVDESHGYARSLLRAYHDWVRGG